MFQDVEVPPPPRGVPGGTRPPETLPWRGLDSGWSVGTVVASFFHRFFRGVQFSNG